MLSLRIEIEFFDWTDSIQLYSNNKVKDNWAIPYVHSILILRQTKYSHQKYFQPTLFFLELTIISMLHSVGEVLTANQIIVSDLF